MDTRTGKVLSYRERLPFLKPHDLLTMWPTWGHESTRNFFISIIKSLMGSKPGRLLTGGRRFSTQTLKSSPIKHYKSQSVLICHKNWSWTLQHSKQKKETPKKDKKKKSKGFWDRELLSHKILLHFLLE